MNIIPKIASLLVLAVLSQTMQAQNLKTEVTESKAMTPELIWKLGRLGESTVSPDGTSVAYTLSLIHI